MATALPEPLLNALSQLLAQRTGLNFPPERWGDLERGLAEAAPDLGMPDLASCAHWLLLAPLTRHMTEVLACHLSIGETYFMRERAALDAFGEQLLPQLLQMRAREKCLRLWSAGCSSGEEAYSIAILLDRWQAELEGWSITLLGTDFNPVALRKAARGIYGDWSFRDTPDWLRPDYFTQLPDGRYEIIPRIRERVTFSYLNLVDDIYPSLSNNTSAMDVVFCRNVLMYFTAARADEVVARLHHTLVDGGWLIVSPHEAFAGRHGLFEQVELGGAMLFRKHEKAAAAGKAAPPRLEVLQLHGSAAAAMQTPAAPAAQMNGNEAWHVLARRCADEGRLHEALAWCNAAIASDKMNPAHHYLHAAIQLEQGHYEAALQSLRRVLYLEPGFVLAHFTLGNLLQAQHNYREAWLSFNNAALLLQGLPPDEVLPHADGMTAGRLVEIIAALLQSMPPGEDLPAEAGA